MQRKITPLLIVAVLCLLIAIWAPCSAGQESTRRSGVNLPWMVSVLLIICALIAWGTDRLIKKHTPELKRIWIIEGVIVVFILLYTFLLK